MWARVRLARKAKGCYNACMHSTHVVTCDHCFYTLPYLNGKVLFGATEFTLEQFRKIHKCKSFRGGKATASGKIEIHLAVRSQGG